MAHPWCAAPPNAPNPTPTACVNTATRRCHASCSAYRPGTVYPALDKLTLSFALERMARVAGAGRPDRASAADEGFTRHAGGSGWWTLRSSPIRSCASACGTVAPAALEAAHDPMIELARSGGCAGPYGAQEL